MKKYSVYNISYKTSTGPKLLHISFDNIDGFIRSCGSKFRDFVLFDNGLFEKKINTILQIV